MFSKQRKRRQAPKISVTVRSKGRRLASGKRVVKKSEMKTVTMPRQRRRRISAPAVGSVVQRGFYGFSFSAAAPHDEFPEGGLRIVGTLPGTSASGALVHDTASVGLFGTTGLHWAAVCPGGSTTTGTGAGLSASLFSGTGVLAVFAQYFRRFRFRRLEMEYNSSVNVSDVENTVVQIGYDRDSYAAAYTTPTLTSTVNASSVRFSSWVPEQRVPIIELMRSDKADELWYCSGANTTITESSSIMRQSYQGAIFAQTNAVALADTTLGNVLYHFVLDLYGFTNQAVADPGFLKSNKQELKRVELPRGNDHRHAPQPDEKETSSFDFVDLTPRSKREKETPPPSVRASSEKGSRRV